MISKRKPIRFLVDLRKESDKILRGVSGGLGGCVDSQVNSRRVSDALSRLSMSFRGVSRRCWIQKGFRGLHWFSMSIRDSQRHFNAFEGVLKISERF